MSIKLSNRESLENQFPMKKIFINSTDDEKNANTYIENVKNEVFTLLDTSLRIGTFWWEIKFVITGTIYEICAIIQIEEASVIRLHKLIKRLSNFKCDEKFNIKTDSTLTEKEKRAYARKLDDLFRTLNKNMKAIKNELEIESKNLREKYSKHDFEPYAIGTNEECKNNIKKLKTAMAEHLKSIICNFD